MHGGILLIFNNAKSTQVNKRAMNIINIEEETKYKIFCKIFGKKQKNQIIGLDQEVLTVRKITAMGKTLFLEGKIFA